MPIRLAWIDLAAWLITLAEVGPRLGDSAFEPWLAAIGLLGLAGALLWLRRARRWRVTVLAAAAVYIGWYFARLYVLEIKPLLAVLPLPQVVADALYLAWTWPVSRLSHGEALDAAGDLWRDWVMPLVQLGIAVAAARAR